MKPLGELVGDSPAIAALRETIGRLLQRHSETRRLPPVLLQGETGAGKGLVARALHRAGPRAGAPFVDVNCAAIPGTLLEAEMFGFERGAFTDARQGKRGLFQAAHHGTIFLDEVGLLPEALQSKLLKVIEEREVRRLGSTRSEPADAWILTATSENLLTATRERRFREDLYHRLAVLTLWLPPLRERGEDVLLLAEHFLARACADYELPAKRLSADARAALLAYPWPGNVRELANVVERVTLLSDARDVTADTLGLSAAPAEPPGEPERGEAPVPLDEAMGSLERERLLEALHQTNWNISRAAARLAMPRNTLRYRIEKHGLRRSVVAAPPPSRAEPAAAAPRLTPGLAAEPPAPVVRWERRRLALLRAGVAPGARGSEPLADTSRALEVLIEKLGSFGGRVEELSPAGIVAAFGLEPVEDAPSRAALAGMAILKAAQRGQPGDVERFEVTVVLHVEQFGLARVGGRVTLDPDAKRAAWAVLDELAARGAPGTILVSPAAARFFERRFELVPVASVPDGGRPAYRLDRFERTGLRLGGRPATFVGRHDDLDLLRGRLRSVLRGRGQVVGIAGDAGIGKSRLLYEFRQGLAGEAVTYLEAQCVSYGTAIPYLPVLDIVRDGCRILETDGPEAITAKVRDGLESVGMDAEEATPYLVHLLGVKQGSDAVAPLSPETVKARTFEILRQMCLRSSRQRPVILAVEDFHWVDTTSSELFTSLTDSLAGAPVLLLVTYRPGYHPPWLERSYATQIALGPLSPRDSLTILRSLLRAPDLDDVVAEAILSRAEGNPLFLEELARALEERGDVRQAPAIPDTIQEVLAARIDRLPEDVRRLLQAAAVLGREAPVRVLGAVADGPEAVVAGLQALTRLEFLYHETAAEEPVYVFKHALVQEVAYASLEERGRRERHGAAGLALERQYAGRTDEIVEVLAHHFGRSREDEKAVDYAVLAGEKAQRRWANTEALAHFETAVARLAAMPDTGANRLRRIDAVVKQAEVMFVLGRHAEHIHALEGIRDLVEASADPRRRAAWYYWTGFLHSLTGGRPEVAIAYCGEASRIADAGGFDEIRAFADSCLAQVYTVAGDLREAVAAGERALATFEARRNVWWACRTLWHLSSAANARGEWARSLEYCRRALDYGRLVEDLRLKVVGWWRTGSTHIQRGDLEAGLRWCEEALAVSPSPFDRAMATAMRGYGLSKAGQGVAGTAAMAEALAWLDRSQLRYTRSVIALCLAEGYLRAGEPGPARTLVEEVLATCRDVGYRHLEGVAHRLLGELLLRREPAAAARHLETAAETFERVDARNELAKALVAQADLAAAAGDEAGARRRLERALELVVTLGTLDEASRVRSRLAAPGGTASS